MVVIKVIHPRLSVFEFATGNGESLILGDESGGVRFAELGKVMDVPVRQSVSSAAPDFLVVTGEAPAGIRPFSCLREHFCVGFEPDSRGFVMHSLQKFDIFETWRWIVSLGVFAAALRGKRVLLMHGALLETSAGHGVLLCADSGTGKSTAARRWQSAGHRVIADDMVLLAWDESHIYAHGLPTWSRLKNGESADKLHYPFNPPLVLDSVLELRRGEWEENTLNISHAEFFARLCRASYYFFQNIIKHLADEDKKILNRTFSTGVDRLLKLAPPRAFYALKEGEMKLPL